MCGTVSTKYRTERDEGMTMAALAGQLLFWAMVAAVIGGVIWALAVMREPRPPLEEADDVDDEW
ncbi:MULTISPECIES: hypothetical protein [Mycolicibacterium]|uniref:Uncharacterized protein n=1 Tax=Mycolicibacterium nivoides TaxID=2487344 RepID=A0ABW9LKQ7_9MYCO|nr:hypothetical protein [Mycolicibacterium fortuitum]UBV18860.1 hypothetical protein H8Z57_21540 [Mycolicibacterium fortuitum]